ncbi:hypothetical protein ALQ65_200293 [Pseudomonas syringae pv. coriandricola]|uniref:Uncharacterized protein n=1 Tax=Pseudomonas syringae pv. coriandricola TaxID=264453 RepID=A0A3M3JRT8_9PSED|nr:hypothetical protein ALQ65_200293 [Pseudomonas syringae pv. coriandricola]
MTLSGMPKNFGRYTQLTKIAKPLSTTIATNTRDGMPTIIEREVKTALFSKSGFLCSAIYTTPWSRMHNNMRIYTYISNPLAMTFPFGPTK